MKYLRYIFILLLVLFVSTPCFAQEKTKDTGKAKVEIVAALVTGGGEIIDVRYRLVEGKASTDPMQTYILDEATGERLNVMQASKIGRLASGRIRGDEDLPEALRDPDFKPVSYALFMNKGGKVKAGTKMTVVIGGIKEEHVVLGE